jgi:hypothetical protein
MKKIIFRMIGAATLLIFSNSGFAQAPTLGAASSFVLFTTTGAVGNTGISNLTGDVGTNTGAITGFGNVNGQMQISNGASALCAADLLTAYNQLNSTIPTMFPGLLLGNGDTLSPAVYQSPAATTLSGDLTLDALGDANAVFIFRVEGPLAAAFGTSIKLINGAQACNVFWKVEGVVSLASSTFFRGTLIANNAAINLSPGDTLEGRMLSTTGAVNVNGLFAYLPTGCGSILLNGPAEPAFGAASCFALFSSNGAVTNAGISYASGDIGTNVGLTVGYNQLFVNGTVHPIPDLTTTAAAADLLIAYNYLNTLPNDIELLFPAQFGNGLILTPHTYHLGAATALTGTVYLDARGNSNAIFVIKANGAFSTGSYAQVVLLNGAQAKNVYWNIDGAVSLGDHTNFMGTIIANNGAIDLTVGDTIQGRAMTTTGALTTASVVVNSPVICFALPASWLYFTGKHADARNSLEWATANEMNNAFFTIEKSKDGVVFETMTTVNASALQNKYTCSDHTPYTKTFYRISQTDQDGRSEIYRTIQVIRENSADMQITHAVVGNQLQINITGATAGQAMITLSGMDGKIIAKQPIEISAASGTYSMNTPLQQGLYLISITGDHHTIYNGKILVR